MSLHRAAETDDLAFVLAYEGSVDKRDAHGFTAVMLAAMEGHCSVVIALYHLGGANLDLTADMDLPETAHMDLAEPTNYCVRGCNALQLAAFNDRPEVCHFLISCGMDPHVITTGPVLAKSAITGYGLCLDGNDPEDQEYFIPEERVRLTDEEKAERVAGLIKARSTYLGHRKRAATLLAKKEAQEAAKRKRAATLLAKKEAQAAKRKRAATLLAKKQCI